MRKLKKHLPPVLHNALGTIIAVAFLAFGSFLITFIPTLRTAFLDTATTPVPLYIAFLFIPLSVVLLIVLMRRIKRWPPTACMFFKTDDFPSSIATRLRTAKKAVFWGTSLSIFIPGLRDELEASLRAGSHIKFPLIKPGGSAVSMANLRGRPEDIPHRNQDLNRNLSILSSLTKVGKLETKVIDYLAPYAMVMFDGDLETGHIYIWLATLGVPNKIRPMFELSKSEDFEWFSFFAEQFRLTWEKASYPSPNQ